MKRSYDAIAGVYDRLANIFIGKALRNAQIYLVQYIPARAKVLIAGGGTGWILEEITKLHNTGLQIDYVDISAGMIAKAKRRDTKQNDIRFLHQSAGENFEGKDYDVILTPFFFDNFSEATMQAVFEKLHQKLNQNGLWLYADFQVAGKHRFFKEAMLFIMYIFFRAACNIEANHLPDVTGQFAKNSYQLISSKTFKQEFIRSAVYRKRHN
ncbi:class I SAM-dependent methyltransferase [Ilyomonas limi]|uniref:Class I SAM-dependent methyltransferase n=1 Tax=Ilyomonas limi TaxID=2575867 RepID=A0A4U3L0J7_9BACT|nr:class I SAM-dependent methyltransferase [Ilyomonas limi]TKK67719.1 class I SAM-dependent methyltransferase [Ilyomonas limi]